VKRKKKEKAEMLLKGLQVQRWPVQMRKLCIAMPLTSSLLSRKTVVIALPARQLSLWGMLDAVRGRKQIGTDQNGNTFWEISNPKGQPDPIREVHYVEKQMVSARPYSYVYSVSTDTSRVAEWLGGLPQF
jgi:hypothetical protein